MIVQTFERAGSAWMLERIVFAIRWFPVFFYHPKWRVGGNRISKLTDESFVGSLIKLRPTDRTPGRLVRRRDPVRDSEALKQDSIDRRMHVSSKGRIAAA